MNNLLLKYDLLDSKSQKEARDFIDFLFMRAKRKDIKKKTSSYREKILSVSTWTEDDIKIFDSNRKLFNQWEPKEW